MSVPLPAEFFGKVGKKYNSQSEEGGKGTRVWGEGSSQPGFDQASERGQVHDAGEACALATTKRHRAKNGKKLQMPNNNKNIK